MIFNKEMRRMLVWHETGEGGLLLEVRRGGDWAES